MLRGRETYPNVQRQVHTYPGAGEAAFDNAATMGCVAAERVVMY